MASPKLHYHEFQLGVPCITKTGRIQGVYPRVAGRSIYQSGSAKGSTQGVVNGRSNTTKLPDSNVHPGHVRSIARLHPQQFLAGLSRCRVWREPHFTWCAPRSVSENSFCAAHVGVKQEMDPN